MFFIWLMIDSTCVVTPSCSNCHRTQENTYICQSLFHFCYRIIFLLLEMQFVKADIVISLSCSEISEEWFYIHM